MNHAPALLLCLLSCALFACGRPGPSGDDGGTPDASVAATDASLPDGGVGIPASAHPLPRQEWMTFFAPTGASSALDIDGLDANAAGEVYGSGYVEGGVRFDDLGVDGQPRQQSLAATIGKDLLLFKLSATGGVLWSQVVPTTGNEGNGYDLVVDRVADAVYTSGSFSGTLNLGGGRQLVAECDQGGTGSSNVYGQAMLLKHDRAGAVLWALQSRATTAFAGGNEVALDGAGDVLFSGTYGAATGCGTGAPVLTLGMYSLPNDGQADAFVTVVDKVTGEPKFAPIRVGGPGYQRAQAVDPGTAPGATPDSLILGVSYKGPTVLYSRTRASVSLATTSNPNDWDMVVAKYDYRGELVWHRSFGSPTVLVTQGVLVQEQLKGVGRDSQGNVLVSGTLTGSVTIEGTTYAPSLLSPTARTMGFVAKLAAADGAVLWFRTFSGEQGINTCCEVVVDANDVAYLTPQVYGQNLYFSNSGSVALNPGGPASSGKLGVILRYDREGRPLDSRNLASLQGPGASTTTSELSVVPGGALYWTGVLEGALVAPVAYDAGQARHEFVAKYQY